MRMILFLVLIAACKPAPQSSSDLAVDNDTQTTSSHVATAVKKNNAIPRTCPYTQDSDGKYDCENYARDVSQLMKNRGYQAQEVGIMRSDAKTLTGTLANNLIFRSKNGGHAQMLVTRPYPQNPGWNRYLIYEPQNANLVTSWVGPPSSKAKPTQAAVQKWQQYLSQKFPKEWQGSSGQNFLYIPDPADPSASAATPYQIYK